MEKRARPGDPLHFIFCRVGDGHESNTSGGRRGTWLFSSIDRDAERLKQGGAVKSDWHLLPARGVVNKTPFIILVRQGNPKGIRDFADLAKPGVKVIHPDPASSGGAQWSILAIYGSELVKSEKHSGERDEARR